MSLALLGMMPWRVFREFETACQIASLHTIVYRDTMNLRTTVFTLGALCVSAIAFYFGMGLHPIWWLALVAPLPVLLVSTEVGSSLSFAAAFAVYFAGGMNMWTYLHKVIGIPLPITLVAIGGPALVFAGGVLLVRALLVRDRIWYASLALPTLWVTYEFINTTVSPHSTFGSIAYSQMSFLPIVQVASLFGIWVISFVVMFVPASLAAIFSDRGKPAQRRGLAIALGVTLCATLGFGAWRLQSAPSEPTIKVTLVAIDTPHGSFPETDVTSLALLSEYADAIRRTVPRGTKVVVLPEKIASVSEQAMPQVDRLFSAVATEVGTTVVVGVVRHTQTRDLNESRLYSPGKGLQATYDKHHLIPVVEKEQPGSARTIVKDQAGSWGLTICKDMDFPRLSREYGSSGVGLLLVPAWDFRIDGWLHGRMAMLRGVENGFSIARSARDGLLTVSDRRGRVVAEVPSSSAQFASVSASLPVARNATLYTRTGDWFAWVNVVCLGVILLFGLRARSDKGDHGTV